MTQKRGRPPKRPWGSSKALYELQPSANRWGLYGKQIYKLAPNMQVHLPPSPARAERQECSEVPRGGLRPDTAGLFRSKHAGQVVAGAERWGRARPHRNRPPHDLALRQRLRGRGNRQAFSLSLSSIGTPVLIESFVQQSEIFAWR